MSKHSFTAWVTNEVTASKCVLLTLYEQYDRLVYMEGPALEREYLEKIGSFETNVIREEIEVELLQKKRQMIQACINRKEPIDEKAIDAQLDIQRQKMYREAAGDTSAENYARLSSEQEEELQSLYQDIIRQYHPQTHPDLTQAHRQLFEKAQEAYRKRNLAALRLISDMLSSIGGDGIEVELMFHLLISEDTGEEKFSEYTGDYSLAALLYDSFETTGQEAVLLEEWQKYKNEAASLMEKMEKIQLEFPHNAAGMLSDPAQIEEYKKQLENRLYSAAQEKE